MSRSRTRRARSPRRVAAAVATAGTIVLGTALSAFGADVATASSHREAPLIAADPAVDNTDLYAFVSPDDPDSVTFVANWFGLQEPNGGPNFYPFATDANYNINVDNDGDAKPDIGYRLTFRNDDRRGNDTFLYNNGPVTSLDDENLLFRQTTRCRCRGAAAGTRSAEGRSRRRRWARPRCRTTPRCATRRSPRCPAAGRSSPARPTTRSSSTCGSSTCSTAAT